MALSECYGGWMGVICTFLYSMHLAGKLYSSHFQNVHSFLNVLWLFISFLTQIQNKVQDSQKQVQTETKCKNGTYLKVLSPCTFCQNTHTHTHTEVYRRDLTNVLQCITSTTRSRLTSSSRPGLLENDGTCRSQWQTLHTSNFLGSSSKGLPTILLGVWPILHYY